MSMQSSNNQIESLLREIHRILGCSVECFGTTNWVRVDDEAQFRKALVNQFDLFEDIGLRYKVFTKRNQIEGQYPQKTELTEHTIMADDVEKLSRLVFRQNPRPTVRVEFPVQIRVKIPNHERMEENCWVSSFEDLKRKMNEMTGYQYHFNVVFCGEQVFGEDFKDWVTGLAGEEYIAEFGDATPRQAHAGGTVSAMNLRRRGSGLTVGGPANLTQVGRDVSRRIRAPMTNLFVEGLPTDWTATNVFDHFKQFGAVTACRVLGKRFPNSTVQSGLVDFETHEEACRAIESARKTKNSSFVIRFANNHRQQAYVPVFNRNLYVKNIPLSWNEEDLRRLFSECSGVVSTCIRTPGVGFVNFNSQENAKAAMDGMQNFAIPGSPVGIAIAFARNGKDRMRKRCEFYQRGVCSYGDSCRNVHVEEEEKGGEPQEICKYYLTGCRFGQGCRNKHVDRFNDMDSEEKSDRYSNRDSLSNGPAPPTWGRGNEEDEAGFKNYFRFFF